jgi:phospholipase C
VNVLDQVDTIVIAMLENRSFDHILGALSLPLYGGRKDIEGLIGDLDPGSRELTNPLYDNYALGHRWRPSIADRDVPLITDAPHSRVRVATQLDWSVATGGFTMAGFAQAYFDDNPGNRGAPPESMMVFPPQLIPMTAFLARNFVVCDHWFAPIPTETQPNRFMALAGFTHIDTNATHPPDHEIVTDWCDTNKIRWRVYHEGFSFNLLFRRSLLLSECYRSADQLAVNFQQEPDDTFPQVILVEPAYADDPLALHPDCNHPPLPMGPGEAFLSRVYRAVTSNPKRWARTVLIVTYDEHGGMFDHVPPLPVKTVAPNGEYRDFTTTGPRVPALIVSPLVTPGSVCHANFDHTSILRFIGERFRPDGIYSRIVVDRHKDGGLNSVAASLTAPSNPIETPPAPPELGMLATVSRGEPMKPVTVLQEAFAAAQAELRNDPNLAIRHPQALIFSPSPAPTRPT